ncbi:hypothetical protein BDD14_5508 [Edaphobacter modestus]|uniref:Uncharacterized protein n=1 Tax=Edaphobacter modestus TaxID=388466 RepID=A0A4Q7YGK2_9BACT|nr:hypothetical protein BDD14_5508 [Edaphobacter modestus]
MKKVCVNVSGLFVEMCLLAMMRYAAYLSFETPRPCKGRFGKQLQVRRFDCSFIFTCPVQTSVGELDVDGYAWLRSNRVLNCPIVLATR